MLLWLTSIAMAGNLYINGTFVEPRSIAGVTLEKVTVKFDDAGNILVEAPGYKIEVVEPPGGVTPPPGPGPGRVAAAPMPIPSPVGPPPGASAVTPARWWLVTEDNASSGHTVEVWINNQPALTVRSGEPQKIVDIGRWLHAGQNAISVKSNSLSATGGSFYVFMGSGSDQSGTVVMDDPSVQFGVGANRAGPYQRDYTLSVDR